MEHNKKEVLLFLDNLRLRIMDFRIKNKDLNDVFKFDLCTIELVINYTELGVLKNRKISKEEQKWFEGRRYLEDTFGNSNDNQDIFKAYLQIVEIARELNLFLIN